jgi:Domain of unknown function (DUF362)/FlgD Ig-like domain/TAT (twin-arginine translocation) pathway signal sequence
MGTRKSDHSNRSSSPVTNSSRRDFLKVAGLTAAAMGLPSLNGTDRAAAAIPVTNLRSNDLPGRILLYHDPLMNGHTATIDRDQVETSVHNGIRLFTGISDVGEAFKSLFPGLAAASTIAIKVNCIGPTDTRWETVRGVISGLAQMEVDGGAYYNVSQVVIYDRHNLSYHGYNSTQFEFGGNSPVISSNNSPSGYYVYGSYRLSNFLIDSDFVINMPALKSHSDGNNQITTAFKNHYGSCTPASLCGNITGMLTLNSDQYVKPKTALILMDGIRGTYNGGPGESPQSWTTFEENTPNTLFFSTDPVTNDYWARETINTERATHSYMPEKPCPWIETASGEPYNLGVSDPAQMNVIEYEASAVDPRDPVSVGTFFAGNYPNPFQQSTRLRFQLARAGSARVTITDVTGRLVRDLGEHDCPTGLTELDWDGRDTNGHRPSAGVYFAHLDTAGLKRIRRIVLAR